ncbi:MAG: dihydroorotate dehydrogenase [Armatimonadota bacterium]|nr:dihydroorotate dehydrogenase [Armatimonadota bacterium]MDR5697825.1 dihydroorotate dehydrogenase [Armatimonadota bacterium]
MPDLSVDIAGVRFPNPVLCAAGPLGHGREASGAYDLRAFGGFVTKSITLQPREGNPRPHVVQTDAGWLNSVGLKNPGLAAFLTRDLPFLRTLGIPIVASIAAHSVAEYCTLVEWLSEAEGIAAIEVNISCPNVANGMIFGTSASATAQLVGRLRGVTPRPLFVKLSPNVTDVVAIARGAADAGADAVVAVNTLAGMAIDPTTRKPRLGSVTGGLSGPAIRPVALRMVWEIAGALPVPVIGTGGIATAEHAVEFFLAGASAVGIGSALLTDPATPGRIVEDLRAYLRAQGMSSVRELVGALEVPSPSEAPSCGDY